MFDVLPVVLLTRLFFVVFTLTITVWRALSGVSPLRLHVATGTFLDLWNRADARWYDDLARLGYNLRGPAGYKNVAFFPLYPMLMRTAHDATAVLVRDVLGIGLSDPFYPPYLVAGMVVANICAIAALVFLYVFVRLDHSRAVARRAVTLLAISPMSFYLFAAYSEGTFLLCAIACFYALRLERWWQAGLWGCLAAATRPPGAVLIVPFLIAWADAHPVVTRALRARLSARARMASRTFVARLRLRLNQREPAPAPAAVRISFPEATTGGRTPRRAAGDVAATRTRVSGQHRASWPRTRHGFALPNALRWPADVWRAAQNGLPVVTIPLGLGLFMAFLFIVFGDPLWFSRAQAAWWRTFAPPWETLYLSVTWPLGDVLHGRFDVGDAYAVHDVAYAAAGLTLTWLAWRRVPRQQGVYLWLVWAVILSSPAMLLDRRTGEPHHDVLMSLPRMLLMMFPLMTYVATRGRLYRVLVVAFGLGLVVYTGIFLTGGWVS